MRNGTRRQVAAVLASAVLIVGLTPATATAAPSNTLTPQQALDQGVADAAGDGVNQYAALVDRSTGELVAASGGNTQVISESIVKLFTVSYYLVKYNGTLPTSLATDLHEMIVHSNDRIESEYWTTAAVPAMAARYGLRHTANGPKTGPHDWGWEYITADDEAMFLFKASNDPIVGPFLMDAMANVASVGADGFDQDFGFNSLDGDHGSKQGWTDLNSSQAINVHSVGWTDQYFGAILETSATPRYDAMRDDSTVTADLIEGLQSQSEIAAEQTAASIRVSAVSIVSQLQGMTRHVLQVAGLIS